MTDTAIDITSADDRAEEERAYDGMVADVHEMLFGEDEYADWTPDCMKCCDSGMIETWGPHDGCAEFMDEPEMMLCDCAAGKVRRMTMERTMTLAEMEQAIRVLTNDGANAHARRLAQRFQDGISKWALTDPTSDICWQLDGADVAILDAALAYGEPFVCELCDDTGFDCNEIYRWCICATGLCREAKMRVAECPHALNYDDVIRARAVRQMIAAENVALADVITRTPLDASVIGAITTTHEFRLAVAYYLESGDYLQGLNQLRYTDRQYCVSGVATDVYRRFVSGGELWSWTENTYGGYSIETCVALPNETVEKSQCQAPDTVHQFFDGARRTSVSDYAFRLNNVQVANDSGNSFHELAHMIMHGM